MFAASMPTAGKMKTACIALRLSMLRKRRSCFVVSVLWPIRRRRARVLISARRRRYVWHGAFPLCATGFLMAFPHVYKSIMMKYLYKIGLSYITPIIMIQLSNNRLYRTPMFRTSKGEINDIHWKTVILVFTEILMQAGIPFFVYARLWHPVSKNFAYSIIVVIAIIVILFMQMLKKTRVYANLLEEADKLTKEEHKTRKKDYCLRSYYTTYFL